MYGSSCVFVAKVKNLGVEVKALSFHDILYLTKTRLKFFSPHIFSHQYWESMVFPFLYCPRLSWPKTSFRDRFGIPVWAMKPSHRLTDLKHCCHQMEGQMRIPHGLCLLAVPLWWKSTCWQSIIKIHTSFSFILFYKKSLSNFYQSFRILGDIHDKIIIIEYKRTRCGSGTGIRRIVLSMRWIE